jgi:hypothetical protein
MRTRNGREGEGEDVIVAVGERLKRDFQEDTKARDSIIIMSLDEHIKDDNRT